MDNGIETREEIPTDENPDRSESGSISLAANNATMEDNTGETTSAESGKDAVKKKTADARSNLISKLKEKKDSRLKRKPQQRTEC